MPRTLEEILASNDVKREDIDALFTQFDADGSGTLELSEIQALASMLAKHFPNTPTADMMEILDFYEVDRDGKLDREELQAFFEIHLDK